MASNDYDNIPQLPQLVDSADPFLGYSLNSPFENGWDETPGDILEPTDLNIRSIDDGIPVVIDFDVNLEEFLAQPGPFGNVVGSDSPSWLDSFIVRAY